MPWARASALARHLACPAASWLPRVDRGVWSAGYLDIGPTDLEGLPQLPPDDGVLAQWGTEMHLAKEVSPDAADPWITWMEPHRERLWPADMGTHELTWGLDCSTGVVTIHTPKYDADEWKKGRGAWYITGTTDWDAVLPSGEPWVDDLKTGWNPPPATAPQMLMYALVAAKVRKYPTVRISVTHWRRGWDEPERKWQQVGPATLEAFEDELYAAARRAYNSDEPKPGPHCRYCPSAPVCPSVTGEKKP